MKRLLACPSLVMAFVLLCQCAGPTRIADITNNPRNYADKEVTVSGEATQPFSLVMIKYFTLRDSTGEIMIVTDRPLPKEGDRVTVKGTVHEAFSIGTKTLLVIMERAENKAKEESRAGGTHGVDRTPAPELPYLS